MGDRSRSEVYTLLLAFLEARGLSLQKYGSAERGLSQSDAEEFLKLLQTHRVNLLGIEPWRKDGERYRLDSVGVWCPEETTTMEARVVEARRYLKQANLKSNDVVAVQF